jgi:hypothetical protein
MGLAGVGIFGLASNTHLLLESSALSWSLITLSLFIFLASAFGCLASLADSKPVLRAVSERLLSAVHVHAIMDMILMGFGIL